MDAAKLVRNSEQSFAKAQGAAVQPLDWEGLVLGNVKGWPSGSTSTPSVLGFLSLESGLVSCGGGDTTPKTPHYYGTIGVMTLNLLIPIPRFH